MDRKEILKSWFGKALKFVKIAGILVAVLCVFYTANDVYAQSTGEDKVVTFSQLKENLGTILVDVANDGEVDGATEVEILYVIVTSITEDVETGILTIKLAGVVPQYPFP